MRVELVEHIEAPRAVVWDVLVDWEQQVEWMLDAVAVEVVSPHRTGVGTTVRCPTRILGIIVPDVVRVVDWEHRERLAVVHLGSPLVQGVAAFELADAPGGATTVTWWEEVEPPLGALGERIATAVVGPLIRAVFGRSLRRLAARCEAGDGVDWAVSPQR